MDYSSRIYSTKNGPVEGVHIRWPGLSVLFATGRKGSVVCGAFDLEAIARFGGASAMVESSPQDPASNLERFVDRNIARTNANAEALGIRKGMRVSEAFERIA